MSTLRNTLVSRACEIIRDPQSWTHLTAARDHLLRAVSPRSPEAKRFCGFGALARAAHEQDLSDRWLVEIFPVPSLAGLIQANDHKGHAAALAYLEHLGREGAAAPAWTDSFQTPR